MKMGNGLTAVHLVRNVLSVKAKDLSNLGHTLGNTVHNDRDLEVSNQ